MHRKKWAEAADIEPEPLFEITPKKLQQKELPPPVADALINPYKESQKQQKQQKKDSAEENDEYDSDSFEEEIVEEKREIPPEKAETPSEEDEGDMKNVIMNLGKKQRDILRESLSTMKQVWQQHAELPEEIISDEDNDAKPAAAKKPDVTPQSVPRPKIICQNSGYEITSCSSAIC